MHKYNLILVHSFPTNSLILKGLISYLNDYFNVYFIDLPGFTKNVPPIQNISFDSYAEFIENKINKFNLDSYILGGISFSFYVVNKVKVDKRCRCIVAIEPYVNERGLNFSTLFKKTYLISLNVLNLTRSVNYLWKSGILKRLISRNNPRPNREMNIVFEQIDPSTFVNTALMILTNKNEPYFSKSIPYILLVNPDDATIKFNYVVNLFRRNIPPENLRIIVTDVEHYPKPVTKKYFKDHITKEEIESIYNFLEVKSV